MAVVCVKLEDGATQVGLVLLQSCVSGWDSEPVRH